MTSGAVSRTWISPATPVAGLVAGTTCHKGETDLIDRTSRRTPEVMVKVLSRGGQDLKAIGRHLGYLNRGGEVDIETDDGQHLSGKGVEKELLEDWDMDLEEHRRKADLESWSSRPPPQLVHKLMFSMPAGTPPDKVRAVRGTEQELRMYRNSQVVPRTSATRAVKSGVIAELALVAATVDLPPCCLLNSANPGREVPPRTELSHVFQKTHGDLRCG